MAHLFRQLLPGRGGGGDEGDSGEEDALLEYDSEDGLSSSEEEDREPTIEGWLAESSSAISWPSSSPSQ